jgi:hypothetical protein
MVRIMGDAPSTNEGGAHTDIKRHDLTLERAFANAREKMNAIENIQQSGRKQ